MSRKPVKGTLFGKILLWLCLPLLLLGFVFIVVQLTNQVRTMNQIQQIQSEIAFQNIHRTIQNESLKPNFGKDKALLEKWLNQLAGLYQVQSLDLYQLTDRIPVFENRSFWNSEDIKAMEEALFQSAKGRPYLVFVNKSERLLAAYMPFKVSSANDEVWVARAKFGLVDLRGALLLSRRSLFVIFFFIVITGFVIAQGLGRSIVRPILALNRATREIIQGQLGLHVNIHTGDEIENLAETFNRMSDTIKEITEKAHDANPLSGLPGNTTIFKELQKRLLERKKFVLFHTDLDRFKIFNDHFGLAEGDKVIKKTAELLANTVKEKGSSDDFVGHQGGDDFIIITQPKRAAEIAAAVCNRFENELLPQFYKKDDYERGYTVDLDRRRQNETGETVYAQFPLMAISLAGISNSKRDLADYSECMSAAVDVKKEAKKTIRSSFIIKE